MAEEAKLQNEKMSRCIHCQATWIEHYEFPWLYCYEWGHRRFISDVVVPERPK